jgi:hypothetical protein
MFVILTYLIEVIIIKYCNRFTETVCTYISSNYIDKLLSNDCKGMLTVLSWHLGC